MPGEQAAARIAGVGAGLVATRRLSGGELFLERVSAGRSRLVLPG